MPVYRITPSDVLFFRDARPFESGSGRGARWPEPNIIFNALHAALHRAWPENQVWEHSHRHGRSGKYDDGRRDKRFGSLQTAGPFPLVEEGGRLKWHVPAPGDASEGDKGRIGAGFLPMEGDWKTSSNLPTPLVFALGAVEKPSKENLPGWWEKSAFETYLAGGSVEKASLKGNKDLFDAEWSTGIGIDPESQTQDGERIYSAEYMRLRKDVHLGAIAGMRTKKGDDALDRLFSGNESIIVGGQQRVCRVAEIARGGLEQFFPLGAEISGTRVKWVLLSPAVFPKIEEAGATRGHPGGWLPNWIAPDSGAVLLTAGLGKKKAERMKKHGKDVQQGSGIGAKLVAARIPKPVVMSGWSERIHLQEDGKSVRGARPTVLAVPAGAVYYFEADSVSEARKLADALNWHGAQRNGIERVVNRRSALLGEQGFGLGVCGEWKLFSGIE